MSRRTKRAGKAFKEEFSDIIQREVKDPRVGFVTITEVKVSPDLRKAWVYLGIMGDDDEVARTLAGLESAKGYMRAHLGKHLRLRFLPEIEFKHEHTAEDALELERLIRMSKEEGQGDR